MTSKREKKKRLGYNDYKTLINTDFCRWSDGVVLQCPHVVTVEVLKGLISYQHFVTDCRTQHNQLHVSPSSEKFLYHLAKSQIDTDVVVLETWIYSLGLWTSRDSFFKSWFWSFGCFFGHKICVSKWRRTLTSRYRQKALFTNPHCVLIVESLNGGWPVISWSVDHHFHGCTSLCYLSNGMIFFNQSAMELCFWFLDLWVLVMELKVLILGLNIMSIDNKCTKRQHDTIRHFNEWQMFIRSASNKPSSSDRQITLDELRADADEQPFFWSRYNPPSLSPQPKKTELPSVCKVRLWVRWRRL